LACILRKFSGCGRLMMLTMSSVYDVSQTS
jgi:hypothetical protein